MSKIMKKSLSLLLALSLIFTFVSALTISASAAGTNVEIVSFVRGPQNDLRSSELLEARVSGYDGNISDLTFEWTNDMGTYLYVYNSSNMYNIKDTAGEVEIGTWDSTFTGKGYAWAAVYGANLSFISLWGSIKVTVKDPNGNILGTDSYSGFKSPSLKADLEATNYGVFKGESINLKDMLGRSSIVHIDCKQCFVNTASTSSPNISLENSDAGYIVTGNSQGVGEVSLTLQKVNCKFHQDSGLANITNKVYVFEKPNTSTTTTTLTLTNLDEHCDYFIGNVQGTKSADGKSIVFTGLTPDTTYEVMVRGNYETGYAYAYVSDTTKVIYRATVNFYTDDVLSKTLEHFNMGDSLYIKDVESNNYIALTNTTTGVYAANVENGTYYLYHKQNGSYTRFGDFQLTIDNKDNEVNVYTYSVRYDTNGGTMDASGSVYYIDSPVHVTTNTPVKAGAFFKHWTDEKGVVFTSGQLLTSAIKEPKVLTAVWEDAVDVKVNVTIDHGDNYVTPAENVTFRLVETSNGVSIPTDKAITLTPSIEGYTHTYSNATTTYTATEATFKDLKDTNYTVTCGKTGYELESVTTTGGLGEDKVINVKLVYKPSNFDLQFKVKMNNDIPASLYPAGVNVRVTYWGYDESNNLGWQTIAQHKGENAAVPVRIDTATGEGTGYYPVWKVWADAPTEPYYYRIEVTSYILSDGTVVTNNANAFKTTVDIENGGIVPTYPNGKDAEAKGAFYSNGVQDGTPVATISIDSYNLTFDANGGKINGNNTLVLDNQLIIPDTTDYQPAKDGGYIFTGWYTDSACTIEATIGSRIYKDTTLYAGWKAPLSINGTVTVEGFYYQDGEKVKVLDVDRATVIVVALQALRNGKYNDVMGYKQVLTYDNNDIATVSYNFTEVPDIDGVEYRISTTLINYTTSYDNNGDKNFTENEFTANFAGSKTAKVDANLTFKADEFAQYFKVDATAIGEGFRPETGITKILFQTTGSNPPNTVISQHTVDPYGEELIFNNGIAEGSIMLWKGISSGAVSHYQLKLSSLDSKEYTHESPYSVRYGQVSSWSGLARNSEILIATVVPKEYKVNFDLNAGEDVVTNMDEYASETGYFTTHKWSYDTEIVAKPVRAGYVFAGWTCDEPDAFDGTYVDASVAKDITLKAVWAEFKWTTDTDAGYFDNNGQKESVIRFLFDIALNEEMKQNIVETGIKYINSSDILENVDNVQFAGKSETGNESTFYGDITDIDESKAGSTYHAIAYVKIGDKYYWSKPVSCKPVFDDLIIYED